ncbi:uncharacterized protein LOC144500490 [Mustelus asterias]
MAWRKVPAEPSLSRDSQSDSDETASLPMQALWDEDTQEDHIRRRISARRENIRKRLAEESEHSLLLDQIEGHSNPSIEEVQRQRLHVMATIDTANRQLRVERISKKITHIDTDIKFLQRCKKADKILKELHIPIFNYLAIVFLPIYAVFVSLPLHSPDEGAMLQKLMIPNKPVRL